VRLALLLPFLFFIGEAAAGVAIVTHDRAVLRGAPHASAQVHATLWQGEALEVRGERLDWLQVYDYRRERGGFVRASQVRRLALTAEEAPELLAVVRFLRTVPGAETLGIALATLYLQTAPANGSVEEGIEALDALGSFAERLALRASPEHLEVAARYGVQFRNVERDGRIRVCYDGEAFRRVLALPSSADQRARAALALTRRECEPGDLAPVMRMRLDTWRAEALHLVDVRALPAHVRNRVLMRRAGVWASVAYYRARGLGGEGELSAHAAQRAIAELAGVDRKALAEEDRRSLADAQLRVRATRWAAAPAPPGAPDHGLRLLTSPGGKPGETCVTLVERTPRAKRCTYGIVWTTSVTPRGDGNSVSVAVQHNETYREAWVFRRTGARWSVAIVPDMKTVAAARQ
jgi:hypothetical protein